MVIRYRCNKRKNCDRRPKEQQEEGGVWSPNSDWLQCIPSSRNIGCCVHSYHFLVHGRSVCFVSLSSAPVHRKGNIASRGCHHSVSLAGNGICSFLVWLRGAMPAICMGQKERRLCVACPMSASSLLLGGNGICPDYVLQSSLATFDIKLRCHAQSTCRYAPSSPSSVATWRKMTQKWNVWSRSGLCQQLKRV